MTFFLNFRRSPSGGDVADTVTVQQVTIGPNGQVVSVANVPASTLTNAVLGKNVMFVTHGFNVNQQQGYSSVGNWQTLLQLDPSFLFVGMVWPGDSSWLGPLCYPGEGRHAIACGNLLANFIKTYVAGADSISFVSHSLGGRFILQAVQQLKGSIPVRQVAVMAGAINDDCLTGEYQVAASWIGEINILASSKDDVLSKAFPIGNVFEGIIDKGHPYWEGALGHTGPEKLIPGKPTGPYQIPDNWAYAHHNYIEVQPPLNPPLPLPQDVPPQGSPQPRPGQPWQPSWSAAFVSTRFK